MNSVNLKRDELLGIVRSNLEKHIREYLESVEDYKKLAVQIAQANLKLAKSGNLEDIAKIKALPAAPVSYESSYNRAIRMLELSVDEVIELEEDVFNQLVLDEWVWKRQWSVSNATYKAGAF